MDLGERIAGLREELIDLRRDFHKHPELGFQEHRTAEKVEDYLRGLGLPVKRLAGTGVVALLEGSAGKPVLLLRADMDGLPVREENEVPYRSVNEGVMHACGHDAHTAMLLVAAKVLAEQREQIPGTIKLVFQPNEETTAEPPGAEAMIAAGVLGDPKVDAAMALHIWTPLASGQIGTDAGPVTATLDVFKIVVRGKGGHTGFPEQAVDPIIAASAIVQAVQTIQTREISLMKPTIIMFGKIEGGTKSNIVPDRVTLEGSMRYLYEGGEHSEENPEGRLRRIVEAVGAAHRVECELEIHRENRAVVNHPGMAALAKRTAEEVLGKMGGEGDSVVSYSCTAGEDFSDFAAQVPSVLYFLGTGNDEKHSRYPHHNPRFNIDEDVLTVGVEMHVRGALNFFAAKGGDARAE
ncbi:MAG: amidohydrolase [Spirochaetales bacterium]|nr:amidohydrolase [Spirochaetales bacterium]